MYEVPLPNASHPMQDLYVSYQRNTCSVLFRVFCRGYVWCD